MSCQLCVLKKVHVVQNLKAWKFLVKKGALSLLHKHVQNKSGFSIYFLESWVKWQPQLHSKTKNLISELSTQFSKFSHHPESNSTVIWSSLISGVAGGGGRFHISLLNPFRIVVCTISCTYTCTTLLYWQNKVLFWK